MDLTVCTCYFPGCDNLPQTSVDLIGFQGVTPSDRVNLEAAYPDHIFFGTGISAQRDGLQNPIAFRKDRLFLHGLDHFWLSDKPHVPGSRFLPDQTETPAACTAAVLMTPDGSHTLRVYNTETNSAPIARVQGISLILSRMAEEEDRYPGSAVFLMGNFHDVPDSKVSAAVTGFSYRELMLSAAAADGTCYIYTNASVNTVTGTVLDTAL